VLADGRVQVGLAAQAGAGRARRVDRVAGVLWVAEQTFYARRPLSHLLVGGVFERFPRLKFALTEAGCSWIGPTLAQLDALSAATDPAGNAVALSGMPGVGKTTLVTHWAQRRCDRYPDGQLYLNANGFGAGPPMDSATALGRLLTALDVPARQLPKTLDKRRDLLNELLSGRRMLIVLDNVRDSGQVRPLIPTSPQTFTLITSRTRLRGLSIREGIRCLTVPSLPERDCLTLLTQVIGADRAGAEAAAVRALAHRLIDAVSEPIPIEAVPATVFGSIGVAIAEGAGTDPIDLLRAADAAMYVAKRNRSGLVFAE